MTIAFAGSGPLAETDLADFQRDGYLVLESGIAAATLDGVIADCRNEWPSLAGGADGLYPKGRLQDAWRRSNHIRDVALAPRIFAALRQLYGREPRPFQTLNFDVGTEQNAHSDTIHFNSEPAGYMCGVWLALEDMDADNGPLVYYPGSHRLPEVTLDDLGPRAEQLSRLRPFVEHAFRRPTAAEQIYAALYEPHIKELIRREGLQPRYGIVQKGQAIIWAANLLHGGSPQKNPARTRLSQATHYFFSGCSHYVPLRRLQLPGGGHLRWRRWPRWIR